MILKYILPLLLLTDCFAKGKSILFNNINTYSQTCEQQPPLGPEKSGRLKEVPDKIKIYTGC
jgi:hypothetical protein